jgi:hypothetical protein
MRDPSRTIVALFLVAGVSPGQEVKKADPKGFDLVDPVKVEMAIQKGVAYLRTADSPGAHRDIRNCDELILYTLINAGIPESDPKVQELLKKVTAAPLERTYTVALQAMALEEIHRVKYQDRIWQCAQFLVDNQCTNGQWTYGEPTEAVKNVPTGGAGADVASAGGRPGLRPAPLVGPDGERIKPKITKKMAVLRTKTGPAGGDNSNSQYAALGLRACFDAGIRIPEDTILMAKKWWHESQHANENKKDNSVATGGEISGTPKGWCYQDVYGVCKGGPAYATMTAGAVGALCIYEYLLGKNWKQSTVIKNGLAWLAANWSVAENKGPSEVHDGAPNAFLYYYLYALERVGMLYDTGKIGPHFWYPDGAKVILEAQQASGAWDASEPKKPTWDTCFAILFLKRATRPLIATEGGGKK